MRKWILVAVLAAGFVLTFASVASADNGPHTGDFTGTTDACAGCHRVHRGQSDSLLKETSEQALCDSCHGIGAPGSDTDVVNGVLVSSGVGLRGGGFTNALMDTGMTGTPGSAAVTSQHNVGAVGIIWGNGAIGSGAGPIMSTVLKCSNCHNPHGISGGDRYRILRPTLKIGEASGTVDVPEETPTINYAVSYDGSGFRTTDSVGTEISQWCSMCHTRYMSTDASTPSGDAIFKYRHDTADTGTGTADKDCLSCHVAHGSSAVMTGHAAAVEMPDGTAGALDDSRLLQVDNRGICVKCHASP